MDGSYAVAVIGGACAGSQIASQLAEHGLRVIVIEQNPLPYGKIEDGLPRWHAKLQIKEMTAIDEKLSKPNIHYIPSCKLGKDVTIEELLKEWGVSMVVLANGAWRDRPLRVQGVDSVRDDSFVYQNNFVYWFNHYHEKNYSGSRYAVTPAPVVIGGGLASIDVVKICQFEMVKQALESRGFSADIVEMEHRGIEHVLAQHGLTTETIELKPARLYYRKRIKDMPLVPLGDDPTPEKLENAKRVREKIVANACRRYGFEVYPLRSPKEVHTRDGSVSGVTFGLNEYKNGKFLDTGRVETVSADLVISSIGSIPEPIPGMPLDGELYRWESLHTGAVQNMPGVYCVGNAITGRGNIRDSSQNAKRLGSLITTALDGEAIDFASLFKNREEEARQHAERLLAYMKNMPRIGSDREASILNRVRALQEERGFSADYSSWREGVLAAR